MFKKQVLLSLLVFFAASVLAQTTITVNNLSDPDLVDVSANNCGTAATTCTLRDAIAALDANGQPGLIIDFSNALNCSAAAPCVINLRSTLVIASQNSPSLIIEGPGWNKLILDGAQANGGITNGRILRVESDGIFQVNGMTLKNGNAAFDAQSGDVTNGLGGAVYLMDNGSFLSFDFRHVKFEANQADSAGGAIYAASANVDLHIFDSWFHANAVTGVDVNGRGGGAIAAYLMQAVTSWFDTNTSVRGGGAIAVYGDSWGNGYGYMARNTFSHNVASNLNGGAINIDGQIYLSKNTFYANTANAGSGGAVYQPAPLQFTSVVTLNSNTITQNQAMSGGGLSFYSASTIGMTANIIAGNNATTLGAGSDIDENRGGFLGSGNSSGYNKIGQVITNGTLQSYFAVTGDQTNFGQPPLQSCIDYGYEIGRVIDSYSFADVTPQTFPLPMCPPIRGSSLTDAIVLGNPTPVCTINDKDQVGTTTYGTGCDVGAIESGDPIFKNSFEF